MNIERAKSIPGFMNDPELEWLAEQASKHRRIAEVGSWRGRSTRALGDNALGVVDAVDTWDGRDNDCLYDEVKQKGKDWVWQEFENNMEGLLWIKVLPIRGESTWVARMLRGFPILFDMIFIDASHGYEFVKADILAWSPLLAPGGLLCGHDFADRCPGVIRAVAELIPGFCLMDNASEERSIWWKP